MRNEYSYQRRTMNDSAFRTGGMNSFLFFIAGLAAGAGLMYFMDPDRGRRRRAMLRDQAVGLSNDARQAINARTEDLSNRAYGLYVKTRKAVTGTDASTGKENRSSETGTSQSMSDQTEATGDNIEIGRSAAQR